MKTGTDIAMLLSVKHSISKRLAEDIVKDAFDMIALLSQEGVRITHFGTFKRRTLDARVARDPRNGASVHVPAKRKLAFLPAKTTEEVLS